MMNPESYYEENLRGKSQEEILRRIRSLKREISRLKRDLEDGSQEPERQKMSDPLAQIKCCCAYLEMAKKAYKEVGGVYGPSNAEKMDQTFNETLADMKRFVFGICGFCSGYEKRTYTVSGERVLCDMEHSLYLKPSNLPVNELFTREEFLQGIAELHIGEWKKDLWTRMLWTARSGTSISSMKEIKSLSISLAATLFPIISMT